MSEKTIRLLKPHTHAGRDYPEGGVLTLNESDADWLIGIDSAEPEEPTKESRKPAESVSSAL